jgi:hypothetical protein
MAHEPNLKFTGIFKHRMFTGYFKTSSHKRLSKIMLESGEVFVICPFQLTEYQVTQACYYKRRQLF